VESRGWGKKTNKKDRERDFVFKKKKKNKVRNESFASHRDTLHFAIRTPNRNRSF